MGKTGSLEATAKAVTSVGDQPFSGKTLSRRERREAHKRAQARAAARAAALEDSQRQRTAATPDLEPRLPAAVMAPSPFGRPAQGVAAGSPSAVLPPAASGAASLPVLAAGPRLPGANPFPGAGATWPGAPGAWGAAGPAATWPGAATSSPMARALPGQAYADQDSEEPHGPVGRGIDHLEGSVRSVGARVSGAWSAKSSTVGVVAGLLLALGSLAVGLAVGGPVLGHEGRPIVALAGVAGFGAGALWASKGWANAARKTRVVAAVLALLLGSSFTVGTLTNPVVVDGQVYLATSTEARSYELLQELRADLLVLATADTYLTYNAAQAGAHYNEYAPLVANLAKLSDKYARMSDDPGALPDMRFVPAVNQTTAAAYWAARAAESKVEVIKADNAKSQADLATHRASYAESVILGGEELRSLAAELDLPLTQMGPTE